MNKVEETTKSCSNCDKKILQNDTYIYEDKIMCDDCAMKAGKHNAICSLYCVSGIALS